MDRFSSRRLVVRNKPRSDGDVSGLDLETPYERSSVDRDTFGSEDSQSAADHEHHSPGRFLFVDTGGLRRVFLPVNASGGLDYLVCYLSHLIFSETEVRPIIAGTLVIWLGAR